MMSRICDPLLCLALVAAGSPSNTPAPGFVPVEAIEQPVSFKQSDGRIGQKLLLSLGFISFIAAGAFVIVRLQQNGSLRGWPAAGKRANRQGFQVLGFKRIHGRTIVVTLQLPSGAVVTLADNGTALQILERVEPGSQSASGKPDETDRAL